MGLVLEAFEAFSSGVFLLQEAFCIVCLAFATPVTRHHVTTLFPHR